MRLTILTFCLLLTSYRAARAETDMTPPILTIVGDQGHETIVEHRSDRAHCLGLGAAIAATAAKTTDTICIGPENEPLAHQICSMVMAAGITVVCRPGDMAADVCHETANGAKNDCGGGK